MNIAKNMEAIFVVTAVVLCSLVYEPNTETVATKHIDLVAESTVQTVVVTSKRV